MFAGSDVASLIASLSPAILLSRLYFDTVTSRLIEMGKPIDTLPEWITSSQVSLFISKPPPNLTVIFSIG